MDPVRTSILIVDDKPYIIPTAHKRALFDWADERQKSSLIPNLTSSGGEGFHRRHSAASPETAGTLDFSDGHSIVSAGIL
jgi:hypothetical protein